MAFTNFDTKEINCKIVYFGAEGAGKTENLRSIYAQTSQELQSGLVELGDSANSISFFDFLPVSLGFVQEFHLKLHLFTLPSSSVFEEVASVLLKGIDGFIFVADSRVDRMADNIAALANARKILDQEGVDISTLPRVVQFNKSDMTDLVPEDVLRKELNPQGAPDQIAVASESKGTIETLQTMAKQVILRLIPSS